VLVAVAGVFELGATLEELENELVGLATHGNGVIVYVFACGTESVPGFAWSLQVSIVVIRPGTLALVGCDAEIRTPPRVDVVCWGSEPEILRSKPPIPGRFARKQLMYST
jgi:hypothetical protein